MYLRYGLPDNVDHVYLKNSLVVRLFDIKCKCNTSKLPTKSKVKTATITII
jgi:hypothetical protein